MTGKDGQNLISLGRAREILKGIAPLSSENVPLSVSLGRVAVDDIYAVSDCPSVDSSLKDGYAVVADDICRAVADSPVELDVCGTVTAGQEEGGPLVQPGTAVRIMTGAGIPEGADAVLTSEFAREKHGRVSAFRDAHPGCNILKHGSDVRAGSKVVRAGTELTPTHLGLLAASGVSSVVVHRLPRIVVVATGSELVAPGVPIEPGKVAASNMITLQAELQQAGIEADAVIIHDDLDLLQQKLQPLIERYDVVLTCGGVLDGDKDLTMQAMDGLGVKSVFRRVRVGPGKGICMGEKGDTLIFNLPGGPPSNHVAFLLLALPGIRRLTGIRDPFRGMEQAVITAQIKGQAGWTQVVYAKLKSTHPRFATHVCNTSRLQAMADANCLIELPEDVGAIEAGEVGMVWEIR